MDAICICANCNNLIGGPNESICESAVYSPDNKRFYLCKGCYKEESILIEKAGTNNIPKLRAKYRGLVIEYIECPKCENECFKESVWCPFCFHGL